jgi:hypothetical protein
MEQVRGLPKRSSWIPLAILLAIDVVLARRRRR